MPQKTTRTTHNIVGMRDRLSRIVAVLNSIIDDDMTLASAARELDISPQRLNREFKTDLYYCLRNEFKTLSNEEMACIIQSTMSPAQRVIHRILGISFFQTYPEIDEERFWNLCYSTLDKRSYDILCMRAGYGVYTKPLTLEECGAHFNLQRERIRQIEAKIYHKLRSTDFLNTLFFPEKCADMQYWHDRKDKMSSQINDYINEHNQLFNKLAELQEIVKQCESGEYIDKIKNDIEQYQIDMRCTQDPIDKWDLSTRSANVLRRYSINTPEQLYNTKWKDLIGMRNLGRRTLQEILDSARKHHCYNPEWKKHEEDMFGRIE